MKSVQSSFLHGILVKSNNDSYLSLFFPISHSSHVDAHKNTIMLIHKYSSLMRLNVLPIINNKYDYPVLSYLVFTILLLSLQPIYFAEAQNSTDAQNNTHPIYIPTTISKEAQEELRKIASNSFDFKNPGPADLIGWKKLYQEMESMDLFRSQSIIDLYQPNITETKLGGVNVLDIKPKNWHDNGKVLVYTHGGAYTLLSANSSLSSSILAADATSLRVVSIDYTVAPFSKWNHTTDQVISVIQALKDQQGYSLDDIAIYGDSAGGGLATGSVLKMRDNPDLLRCLEGRSENGRPLRGRQRQAVWHRAGPQNH